MEELVCHNGIVKYKDHNGDEKSFVCPHITGHENYDPKKSFIKCQELYDKIYWENWRKMEIICYSRIIFCNHGSYNDEPENKRNAFKAFWDKNDKKMFVCYDCNFKWEAKGEKGTKKYINGTFLVFADSKKEPWS